jgi:adenylate cyclase
MTERTKRRLAAVVASDVAGYARLTGADEEGTLRKLRQYREELIDPLVEAHGGRIANTAGDSLLIEFLSVTDAVRCSLDLQHGLAERNAGVASDRQIRFRIGINVGDVIAEGTDLLGDAVNIASRVESLSEAGGIAISDDAYRQIRDRLSMAWQDGGEQQLKNISRRVRIWRWSPATKSATSGGAHSNIARGALPVKPSIVVLPFKNLSGDPNQEYFADGLTEDLITAISYWRRFPVIARNSSFTYKGRSVRPEQIAADLGVRYILDGSLRKAGNRIRVTASLVDTEYGHELWAERMDRNLDDIFELQDEITKKVAATTGYQLEQAEIARTARSQSSDVTSWDLVAQGLPHFYEHTCDANRRARQYFEKAVAASPSYSDAWAYLSWAHGHDLMIDCVEDREATTSSGIDAGLRAISLDENSALAHLALGSVYIWSGNVTSGLAEAKRALELNPNDVRAGFAVGNRLTLIGDFAKGVDTIKAALSLNPRDPFRWHYFGYLSRAYLSQGKVDQAFEWAQHAVQIRPDQAETHFRLALCHAHRNNLDDAKRELAICDQLTPGFVARRRNWRPYPDAEKNQQLLAPLRNVGLL